jgi:hypothetical protein
MRRILTVPDIIKRAGGATAIETASKAEGGGVTAEAVYKWPGIGIPDRHWPLIMRLSGATASQMLAANVAARSAEPQRAAS